MAVVVRAYVESGVGAHLDDATIAWAFDLDLWGVCGQGLDEASALAALSRAVAGARGVIPRVSVAERIHGDELAFARDHEPATGEERARTLEILVAVRRETLSFVESLPGPALDWDDPGRTMPAWATWRTIRQMAWHVADNECRYYLPRLGLAARPRADDVLKELRRSGEHVRAIVADAPPALVRHYAGEVWTTTKVFRRLAWHERGELVAMRQLGERARRRLGRDWG